VSGCDLLMIKNHPDHEGFTYFNIL
jgi:hypothetical protein